LCASNGHCVFLELDEAFRNEMLAEDHFHPGPAVNEAWAKSATRRIMEACK
jgi:hypothetical protein